MIGTPVFMREILSHSRRPRTYVFQTIFLSVLVVCLIPLWPAGGNQSGAAVADTGRKIFEYGGYLQIILLALLAPAITANAIVEEKASNTLDLLLLTGTGPFAIVLGKFISRLYVLLSLLFLTVPLLFALLTLGGVSAGTIVMQFAILVSFSFLGAGLGIFFSTILPRVTSALLGGYFALAFLLGSPAILSATGLIPESAFAGSGSLAMAYMSPLYDMVYLFRPTQFVSTNPNPDMWWVTPSWNLSLGLLLVLASGLILPYARGIESMFSMRNSLEAIDRVTYLLLRPSLLLKGVRPSQVVLPSRERVPDAPETGAISSQAAAELAEALADQAGAPEAGEQTEASAPREETRTPEAEAPAAAAPARTHQGVPAGAVHAVFLLLLAGVLLYKVMLYGSFGFGARSLGATVGQLSVWFLSYMLCLRTHLRGVFLALCPVVVLFGIFVMPLVGFLFLGALTVVHWLTKPAPVATVSALPGGLATGSAARVEASRSLGRANPVYWKETTVNTIGRFRYWWRLNLAILVCMLGSYWFFNQVNLLDKIEFQKTVVAILAGLIVILATIIAATTVSAEREDGTLVLLATTPIDCATYVEGKVRGIARNIVFLVALPFVHVAIFVAAGVISPWTLIFLLLSIPIAAAASIVQGIFVSLMFPTTMRAIMWSIVVLIIEAILPLVCCLPQFNLPLACYYMVEPAAGMATPAATGGASFVTAMLLAMVFGGSTQLGYTFVVYSLIRSGFDRYIGRAA